MRVRRTTSARVLHLNVVLNNEELTTLRAIEQRFPSVSRSMLTATLLLLGELAYWQSLGSGGELDRDKLLVAVQEEQRKHSEQSKP